MRTMSPGVEVGPGTCSTWARSTRPFVVPASARSATLANRRMVSTEAGDLPPHALRSLILLKNL